MIEQVVTAIRSGGVVAYPTEAVWGLGCDPWNRDAVAGLLRIKRRPVEKGLIVVAASEQQIEPLLQSLTEEQLRQLRAGWPGPETWLIPDPGRWVPDWVRGANSAVAVRVSAHPVVRQLCEAAAQPLISTSANRSGEPPFVDLSQLKEQMGELLSLIVPGNVGSLLGPTSIRDLVTGRVVRPGFSTN